MTNAVSFFLRESTNDKTLAYVCGDPCVPDNSEIYQKEGLIIEISDSNTMFEPRG